MTRQRGSALASVFGDDDDAPEPQAPSIAVAAQKPPAEAAVSGEGGSPQSGTRKRASSQPRPVAAKVPEASAKKDSHPGKKPVLIHIPEDMHRMLRQLSVLDDGEPLTRVVERSLREYLAKKGHTKFLKTGS